MADLFGTYDKRIKFTTDNTKIDATLTWFPVTVLLTATAGEEVFVELDADTDFDKCAFTKSDGVTELYADCELYDVSEEKAIYHVSLDGWEIASGTDTDFYMYYDDDASANTGKISKSGGTAAQSVYDANFKAVYHMHDFNFTDVYSWTEQYEATVKPDSDGWTLGGTDYASVTGGILTIDSSAEALFTGFYYQTPDVDFDAGFYLKTSVKAIAGNDAVYYTIRDGTQNERVSLGITDTQITWIYNGDNYDTAVMDTTTDYVVYEIYVKGSTFWIYADGVLKGTNTVDDETVTDIVLFGDPSTAYKCNVEIDYVYYALGVARNPVNAIIDSTSNTNDGTKKDVGEPAEVAGKVGQAQHFDGTDDYIELADDSFESDSAGTIETIINRDVANVDSDTIFASSVVAGANMLHFVVSEASGYNLGIQHYISGTSHDYIYGDIVIGATARHVAVTSSGTAYALYVDGVPDALNVLAGSNDGKWFAELAAATHKVRIGLNEWVTTTYKMDGIEDEFRYSSSARAAAWVKATKNSLFDTLLTYGNEETSGVAVDNAVFFGCNF